MLLLYDCAFSPIECRWEMFISPLSRAQSDRVSDFYVTLHDVDLKAASSTLAVGYVISLSLACF